MGSTWLFLPKTLYISNPNIKPGNGTTVCMSVCVCVWEREREREKERFALRYFCIKSYFIYYNKN